MPLSVPRVKRGGSLEELILRQEELTPHLRWELVVPRGEGDVLFPSGMDFGAFSEQVIGPRFLLDG
jgi:hypothetical protein